MSDDYKSSPLLEIFYDITSIASSSDEDTELSDLKGIHDKETINETEIGDEHD